MQAVFQAFRFFSLVRLATSLLLPPRGH